MNEEAIKLIRDLSARIENGTSVGDRERIADLKRIEDLLTPYEPQCGDLFKDCEGDLYVQHADGFTRITDNEDLSFEPRRATMTLNPRYAPYTLVHR